jgi:hypothetical protein
VKLRLGEISDDNGNISVKETSDPLQYKIEDKVIELGKEFTIQTRPNGTILDITDIEGNVKGKIEFRQNTEALLSPVINIVTINTDNAGVDFSTVVTNLNDIYNTMNVAWQKGKSLKIEVNTDDYPLIEIYNNTKGKERKHILKKISEHSDYKTNQYYMIIVPVLPVAGFAPSNLKDNWFFVRLNSDEITPSHELGHCNGLDEFAVNIGVVPNTNRNASENEEVQYKSTNVMGYTHSQKEILKDFYSWQIPVIRERIKEQLNKK